MKVPRLTKRVIDSLPVPKKDVIYHDEDLPGFGLRCKPSGSRSFMIQYEREGRVRRLTLGQYGRITPSQAREMALERFAEIARGGDPSKDRRKALAGPTVADLAETYLERHARPKKKPSSTQTDERLLRLIVLPTLGRLKVAAVNRADVAAMHDAHRATPVQANRAVSLAGKMFSLAERWGYRPDGTNPARNIERYREKPRKRYLSEAESVRLAKILSAAESEGTEHPSAILCIRLLLFTGARRGEILGLRWDEVDFEGRRLRLEDSKTGSKDIHLGAPPLELLKNAVRIEGNPFVCWGETPAGRFIGIDKSWRRIRAAAGIEDVRLHDLRHTFASVAVGRGLSLSMIGALLGHKSPATTQRYAHLQADPLQQAASDVSAEIAAALDSREAEVIPIDRTRAGHGHV